jgi:kynurenine formamidase
VGAAQGEPLHHRVEATKVIDLSHPMYEGMPVWPGGVPFKMTRLFNYERGFRLHKFTMAENVGTHVDAPTHFVEDKRAIDGFKASDLIVPAVVIDIRDRVAGHTDYRLTARDVRLWEEQYGTIPAGSLVILNTGWHRRFADRDRYVNMGPDREMHFPGFGLQAARILLARDVAGLGIDTLSLDHGPSRDFPVHHVMLGADKFLIENLANLYDLPPKGATVVIGVLNVKEASQAQARIFALLP